MNDFNQIKDRKTLLACIFATVLFCHFIAVPIAKAHRVSAASVLVEVDTKNQTYKVGAALDVDPSEDQTLNDQISPEDAARTFAEDYLSVRFDESEQKPKLEIHIETSSDKDTPVELQRKQVIVNLTGEVPKGAKDFLLYIDPSCPMAVVMVFIKDGQPARRMQVVLPGEFSRPFNAEPILEGDPFEATEAAKEPVAPEPEVEKPVTGGEHLFRSAWKAFFGGTLLPFVLLAAVLLLGQKWQTNALLIVTMLVGQGIGQFLVRNEMMKPLDWSHLLLAAGVIIFSVASIFRKDRVLSRWWLVPVIIIAGIQGMYLFSGSDSAAVISGFGIFQVIFGILIALLLHFLIKQKWCRAGFGLPAAAILIGYGLFLLIEGLM